MLSLHVYNLFRQKIDRGNRLIRRLVVSTGLVTTLAGAYSSGPGYADGVGTASSFTDPYAISMDAGATNALIVRLLYAMLSVHPRI